MRMEKDQGLPAKPRLAAWPLLLVFLLFSLGIAITAQLDYLKQKKAEYAGKTAELSAICALKVSEIRRWLDERLGDARLITKNPDRTAILAAFLRGLPQSAAGAESIRDWMTTLRDTYRYENVFLLDRQGRIALAASPHHVALGAEGRSTLAAARERREAVLSDLHTNPQMPHIHMGVLAPLLAADEVAGFVLLRIDPNRFLFPLIQSWPAPSPTAETLLVRREGRDLLYLNELRHRRGTAMKLRLPLSTADLPAAQAATGKSGILRGQDYRGVPVWSSVQAVPGTLWFMVAKVDEAEILTPLRRRARLNAILALALILATGSLVLLLWRGQTYRFHMRQLEARSERQALVKHFDYLSRHANDLILLSDGEHNIIEANERVVQSYGYSRAELLGMSIRQLRVPGERDFLDDQYGKAREQDGIIFETLHQRRDGSNFPVEVSARIIQLEGREYFQSIYRDISERKRAEIALRESEDRFRRTLNNMLEGCQIIGPDWRYLYVNEAATRHGHARKEYLLGRTMMSVFPGIENTEMFRTLERCMKERLPQHLENEFIYPDGSKEWFELSMQPVPEGVFILSIDIGLRKKAEERLRENHMLLRIAGELARIGGWNVNLEENRSYWSHEVAAIHEMPPGYSPSVEEGINFYAPEWRERITKVFSACAQNGVPYNEEMEIVTATGKRLWVHTIGEAVRNEKGMIYKVQGAFQDITERKRAEEELRSLSARNQALLDAVPDIIMEVDANKVYIWANHAGIEFFGDDVIGREASFYFEGEQETYQSVKPVFNGREEVLYVESWQRRRDGGKRLLAWWCRVLKDSAGNVSGALSSARDITDQRHAEEEIRSLNEDLEMRIKQRTTQLEAANKELEAFSYSVSHDLRAPLRAIDGFSRIILEDYAPKLDKEGKRLFDVIAANTHKMGLLIDDLLSFSRLNRQQIAFVPVNLAAMAKVICAELKKQEKGRQIEFRIGTLPVARGDYAMLQQVLQNLLANAVKFTRTRPRARIDFSGEAGPAENVYRIKDNGVGFDMQYAGKLFGVFQRLHGSDEFEGTGVGLAIVQRIIARHGGRVWAESKDGKGATFYFSLPKDEGPGDRVEGLGVKGRG